jgi:hypothetical protein
MWYSTRMYTEKDIGKDIDKIESPQGTTLNLKIVHVYCLVCGEEFIGTRREAGGFLGGHECYHAWEAVSAKLGLMA